MEDERVGIAVVIENCVVSLCRLNGVEGWIPRIVARLDNFLSAGPAENGGIGILRFGMGTVMSRKVNQLTGLRRRWRKGHHFLDEIHFLYEKLCFFDVVHVKVHASALMQKIVLITLSVIISSLKVIIAKFCRAADETCFLLKRHEF